jgi:hypothetical protein
MTYLKLQEEAKNKSFLGTFQNEDGETYCTVYDSTILTPQERGFIQFDENGQLGDVWHQVSFMTPAEFEKRSQSLND